MRTIARLCLASVLLAVVGCGGPQMKAIVQSVDPTQRRTAHRTSASSAGGLADSDEQFRAVVAIVRAHDDAHDWDAKACGDVADRFATAALRGRQSPERRATGEYDAGLVLLRCGASARAREHFEAAVSELPRFHPAKVELAMLAYEDKGDLDGAIEALAAAIKEADFQSPQGLVYIARLESIRSASSRPPPPSPLCHVNAKDYTDFDCAKLNLQRALAIDGTFLPAYAELALHYVERARREPLRDGARTPEPEMIVGRGRAGERSRQMLEIAALVCEDGLRVDATYAALHNARGIVAFELGQATAAVESFRRAHELDPTSFDTALNLAAAAVALRDFVSAEQAYARAVALRPSSYEAHLGLALSLRGQMDDSGSAKRSAAEVELATCKRLAPERPEAYFNEGVLDMAIASLATASEEKTAVLKRAVAAFDVAIEKAGSARDYHDAVKRAKERQREAQSALGAPPATGN